MWRYVLSAFYRPTNSITTSWEGFWGGLSLGLLRGQAQLLGLHWDIGEDGFGEGAVLNASVSVYRSRELRE
jgi:hypothetical protein